MWCWRESLLSGESCCSLCSRCAPGLGFLTLPTKRGRLVVSSRMKKRKGRFTLKEETDIRDMAKLVAAAASTPASLSSKVDLCCTLDTTKSSSEIPRRSGV